MHITWILSEVNVGEAHGNIVSPLASYRYRVAIPMHELRLRGHTCSWVSPGAGTGARNAALDALQRADVAIFSKNHTQTEQTLTLLDDARARGIPAIVDVCDDYFEPGAKLEPYYRALVDNADAITASCSQLATFIEQASGHTSEVISDPYEGPGGSPRWRPKGRQVKALWFGNTGNMQSLIREAEALPARIIGYKADLLVLTRPFPGIHEAFERFSRQHGGKITLRFKEWSLERNWAELRECDLVMLPVDERERFYRAKGPNRLIEALWAGRFAVANSIPAYDEFSPWAWVGDIAEGIAWSLDHADEVEQRIAAAREHIQENYSPAAIAVQWERTLARHARRNGSGN